MKWLADHSLAFRRHRPVSVRSSIGCLAVVFSAPVIAATSVDICQEPADESRLAIAYYTQAASRIDEHGGETNLENFNTDLVFKTKGRWSFGAGHRMTVLNDERIELQTNGYLHTFFFPLHRQSRADDKGFRLSVAPALSASSNVASDLDEYTLDAVQLLVAAVWRNKLSERFDLEYGVCGDHRLGRYRVYPLLAVGWQINPDWRLVIGFPTSQLSYRISSRVESSLRISPNGNEWYVKDKRLENDSRFVSEAFLAEWTVAWRVHPRLLLAGSWGRQFNTRYEAALLDGSRVRLSGDSADETGVAFAWMF